MHFIPLSFITLWRSLFNLTAVGRTFFKKIFTLWIFTRFGVRDILVHILYGKFGIGGMLVTHSIFLYSALFLKQVLRLAVRTQTLVTTNFLPAGKSRPSGPCRFLPSSITLLKKYYNSELLKDVSFIENERSIHSK